jgi:predicted nucleic acid-binding protein
VRHVVVDASALAAIVFTEPEGPAAALRLDGAIVSAPVLLRFELANVAWKKMRSSSADRPAILMALSSALAARHRIVWHDVGHPDVLLIARATGLSTYDASYVWLAGWLGAELVTLDQKLVEAVNAVSAV